MVLWFDEHNHPVTYQELTAEQRKTAHRERCYKLVSLLHLRGASCVYAAAAVVAGNLHELPILYELVEQFVQQVGPGVMKKLILDRGFIDGARIAYCKTILGVEVLIPLKKKMDLWKDAWQLAERLPWQPWVDPPPPVLPTPPRPALIQQRENKRQATLARLKAQAPPPDPATGVTARALCPIKGFQWTEASVRLEWLHLVRHTPATSKKQMPISNTSVPSPLWHAPPKSWPVSIRQHHWPSVGTRQPDSQHALTYITITTYASVSLWSAQTKHAGSDSITPGKPDRPCEDHGAGWDGRGSHLICQE